MIQQIEITDSPLLPQQGEEEWDRTTVETSVLAKSGSVPNGPDTVPDQSKQATVGAKFRLTQLGNTERLVDRHGKNLRFGHSWEKWLVWMGNRWEVDETGEIERWAEETIRSIYNEASQVEDQNLRDILIKHARKSESRSEIQAMIALARSQPGIPVLAEELDRNPMLLNCRNGTLDLKTGILKRHRQEDLITKMAPVRYDPTAQCPTWLEFLNRIFGGDEELVLYVQKVIGYALTGKVNEKALFVFNGGGNNGKTTLLETVRALLGDYAGIVEIDMLMQNGRDDVRDRAIALLVGKRFITSSEAQEGQRLHEAKVKHLTGMGRLQGRHIYGSPFEFDPQFKLFVDANHKPEIRGTDNAIWDRIHLIPSNVSIPKEEQDRDLGNKLRAELSGILVWAVEGCLAWQKEGLKLPRAVTDAGRLYRTESDVVGDFIADCCVKEPEGFVLAADLYKAYKQWSSDRGDKDPFSATRFGTRLGNMGFEPTKTGAGRGRKGLRLRPDQRDQLPTRTQANRGFAEG